MPIFQFITFHPLLNYISCTRLLSLQMFSFRIYTLNFFDVFINYMQFCCFISRIYTMLSAPAVSQHDEIICDVTLCRLLKSYWEFEYTSHSKRRLRFNSQNAVTLLESSVVYSYRDFGRKFSFHLQVWIISKTKHFLLVSEDFSYGIKQDSSTPPPVSYWLPLTINQSGVTLQSIKISPKFTVLVPWKWRLKFSPKHRLLFTRK
jgi:hypothetical protein